MNSDLQPSPAPGGPVLLYDGECGLCNRAVRLLLRIDARGVAPLCRPSGPAGQSWLREHGLATSGFDSMVFVPAGPGGGDAFDLRTDALVAALQACGGWGRFLAWVRIVPGRSGTPATGSWPGFGTVSSGPGTRARWPGRNGPSDSSPGRRGR